MTSTPIWLYKSSRSTRTQFSRIRIRIAGVATQVGEHIDNEIVILTTISRYVQTIRSHWSGCTQIRAEL